MPDSENAEPRGSDEDAAWRDLVARFDVPATTDQPSPWPDREDPDVTFVHTNTTGTPTVASWRTAETPAPDPEEEHFIPPPPPPLPRLEPLTKAAWAGLFGGPGYLLVATAARWSIPGIAVFCAIAAFVAGVALLVLRLNDSGPSSSGDDDDDGAVV